MGKQDILKILHLYKKEVADEYKISKIGIFGSTARGKVVQRFQAISKPNDFADTSAGVEKMDAICMMLIVIGESLKKLDKVTDNKLLSKYPEVDWKKAKGMRDIITHHYADINAETVFFTCKKKIPNLLRTIQKITNDLKI